MGTAGSGSAPAENLIATAYRRLTTPGDTVAGCFVAACLLVGDLLLTMLIVRKVPYTEIDWVAYMQEVEGYDNGERDYINLKGQTGPCVYPAGFIYVFSFLRKVTGEDIPTGQVIFIGVYIVNLALVLAVYIRSKAVPPYALALLCLSKRVHSIYVLRLFNDCVAVLLLHAALAVLQRRAWKLGLLLFSAAVSIKMNIVLFVPSLFLLLLKGTSVGNTAACILLAGALQLALAWPFLRVHAWHYISMSFDLSRKFIYYWSVNFKFLSEEVFLSKPLALGLLGGHVTLLLLFAQFKWCRHEGGVLAAVTAKAKAGGRLTAEHVSTVMWVGQFVGIVLARTLHYQFYCWYFHSIPYLLWRTAIPTPLKFLLFGAIEVCWNVYPSNAASSAALMACHLIILLGLLWTPMSAPRSTPPPKKKAT